MDEFLLRIGTWVNQSEIGREKTKVTFHPHCHQRAEGLADDGLPSGSAATVAMLDLAGFDVELIDAGCCGMAGTFGYDAEHYELSMQVGELGVLPKVRGAAPSTRLADTSPNSGGTSVEIGGGWEGVVSTGSACRLQIKQGAGVTAKHPLELVRDRLKLNG
jgi:Fe-S oxidoreductase